MIGSCRIGIIDLRSATRFEILHEYREIISFWTRWLEEGGNAQSTLRLVYSVAYRLLLNLPLGSFVQTNQYYIWLQICRQFREG